MQILKKKLAETLNLDIQNKLGKFKYDYFKDKGYPPEVLTARVQNVIGTEAWENMPIQAKKELFNSIYNVVGYSSQELEKFTKNPKFYLQSIMNGYIPNVTNIGKGSIDNLKFIYKKYMENVAKPIDDAIYKGISSAKQLTRDIKRQYFSQDRP